jgi:hypothetical protein
MCSQQCICIHFRTQESKTKIHTNKLLDPVNFSQVIHPVRMELQSNISVTISALIIRVGVMSVMTAHCICTHNCKIIDSTAVRPWVLWRSLTSC